MRAEGRRNVDKNTIADYSGEHKGNISAYGANGKTIPLQSWRGHENSRRLKLPDFKTISTWMWYGCQHSATAVLNPCKYSWYSFPLEAESTPGAIVRQEWLCQWKIPIRKSIGNRTRDFPACSAVRQPTAPPLIPHYRINATNFGEKKVTERKMCVGFLLIHFSFCEEVSKILSQMYTGDRGGTVVKLLCYKSECRWFDPNWCHWNFSLT